MRPLISGSARETESCVGFVETRSGQHSLPAGPTRKCNQETSNGPANENAENKASSKACQLLKSNNLVEACSDPSEPM